MPALANLTTTRAGQSAHGLDGGADEHWSRRAFCGTDPDFWQVEGTRPQWHRVGEAIHGCNLHCPVRAECERDTEPLPCTVVAGTYYNQHGEKSARQPSSPSCRHCRPGGV